MLYSFSNVQQIFTGAFNIGLDRKDQLDKR